MSKLNQQSLAKLLGRLRPSAKSVGDTGEEYTKLHQRLSIFFQSHGALSPEELADKTLDRVMQILDEGVREIADIRSFTLGVARNVLRETWKERRQEPLPESISEQLASAGDGETRDAIVELRYSCCQKCLAEDFAEGDRRLLIGYYEHQTGDKIASHRALAEKLGISENALRIRVCRLRARLEDHINRCCEKLRGPGNDLTDQAT